MPKGIVPTTMSIDKYREKKVYQITNLSKKYLDFVCFLDIILSRELPS